MVAMLVTVTVTGIVAETVTAADVAVTVEAV